MAAKGGCNGYAGKIGNTGGQEVQAVYPASHSKSSKVTKGDDLRVKKGKK
mgnify:CR=1 FL=1